MSNKARKSAAEKRRKEKRARKEQMQKQYQQFAAEGRNKKSKRQTLNTKRNRGVKTKRHAMAKCDNIGCQQCHPQLNLPEYATNPDSCLFGKKFRT